WNWCHPKPLAIGILRSGWDRSRNNAPWRTRRRWGSAGQCVGRHGCLSVSRIRNGLLTEFTLPSQPADLLQCGLLLGLTLRCGKFGLLPLPFFLSGTLLRGQQGLCSLRSSLSFLSRRLNDCAVVSPSVESPVHPMPEASRWDAVGSRIGHPTTIDELPLRSTIRQGVERGDEV